MGIDPHAAALVQRHAHEIEPQALRERLASDRDQHDVGVHGLDIAALGRLDLDLDAAGRLLFKPGTLLESLNSMPCFCRMRWNCRATSLSMPGRIRSRYSTTVTCAPRRCQTEPSSSPITPAPITTTCPAPCRASARRSR